MSSQELPTTVVPTDHGAGLRAPRAGEFPQSLYQSCAPGLLVVVHGVLDSWLMLAPVNIGQIPSIGFAVVMGVILIQPVVLGMWISLIDRPFYQRFLAGLAACVLVAFIVGLGRTGTPGLINASFIEVLLAFFISTMVVLSPVRDYLGYRIGHVAAVESTERHLRQFGIRHVLIATFLVAALGGVLRFLAQGHPSQSASRNLLPLAFFFAMLLPPLIIPWATLAYRADRKNHALMALALCVLGSGGCIAALSTMQDLMVGFPIRLVAMLQLGAILGSFASALALRLCGYRIIGITKAENFDEQERPAVFT